MNGHSQFREAWTETRAEWEISRGPEATRPITTCDTGLGTTYERWALNRLLARLQTQLSFLSVFEGPGDGMTGIAGLNSLPLGLNGAQVTLVLNHPAQASFATTDEHHVMGDVERTLNVFYSRRTVTEASLRLG